MPDEIRAEHTLIERMLGDLGEHLGISRDAILGRATSADGIDADTYADVRSTADDAADDLTDEVGVTDQGRDTNRQMEETSRTSAEELAAVETQLSSGEMAAQQQAEQARAAMNAQQQQAWQQAMQQQQQQAMMNQLNQQAQMAAMNQAAEQPTLNDSEIQAILQDLLADDGNVVEGGAAPDGSMRTLEATGVDELDVSEVSLEKVADGPLSEQEVVDIINQASDLNGVPDDPEIRSRWVNTMYHMANAESGLNPNAANGWDSNAVGAMQSDGYPAQASRGIWQTIPSTMAAYHVSGTSNSIYDPLTSAAAAQAYMMDRYDITPDGRGLDEFAGARGIDPNSGTASGGYKGY